jgi:flagellin
MSIVVNTNIASLIAQNNLSANTDFLQKAMQQISSGQKINSASDDAAGLSISESIKTQINGNKKALSNIQTGGNVLSIAEGGQVTVTSHLQRIRELCVQAASETYKASDKDNILQEIKQRLADIDNIASSTTFNGVPLLDRPVAPATTKSLSIQIGANSDPATNALDIGPALSNVHITALGNTFLDVATNTVVTDNIGLDLDATVTGATWDATDIRTYMNKVDDALTTISSNRALLGAYGNRLQATAANTTIMNTNLTDTRSRILDADVAESSSDMVKYQILQQTSASILTQANQLPSLALSLLG